MWIAAGALVVLAPRGGVRQAVVLTRAVLALVLVAEAVLLGATAPAGTPRGAGNAVRADHGRAPLDQAAGLQADARQWADQLAATGTLRHDPAWDGAEIVGKGTDWHSVVHDERGFLDSDRHRAIPSATTCGQDRRAARRPARVGRGPVSAVRTIQ